MYLLLTGMIVFIIGRYVTLSLILDLLPYKTAIQIFEEVTSNLMGEGYKANVWKEFLPLLCNVALTETTGGD